MGQVLFCAVNYFKDREFTTGELNEKLLEHGWNVKPSTLSTKLSLLTNDGLLIKTNKGYKLPKAVIYDVR
jgi:DNA-binding HxlR family transcriptional regulator